MKITFNINYRTNWGEALYIYGGIPALGDNDPRNAAEMQLVAPDTWQFIIETNKEPAAFDYQFVVKAPEKSWRFEWGRPHSFQPGKGIADYNIFDSWHDMPEDKPFYSSAFVDGMLRRSILDQPLRSLNNSIRLSIAAPLVRPDEKLVLCGNQKALGEWNPSQGITMNDSHFPIWEVNIPLDKVKIPFEYKFVIVKKNSGEVVEWEGIDNRVFGILPVSANEQIVIEGLKYVHSGKAWKGAGTAIPVFSIRTEDDFGVGDFIDMKKMIDWCVSTDQKILQILPINDTTMTGTWVDSYPYKSNSTFALHPMYIRLEHVGTLKSAERREHYARLAKELNSLNEIDYELVNNAKLAYLREIFAEIGSVTRKSDSYKAFVSANEYWLKSYAAWCVLRDLYRTPDNNAWGEYATYNESNIDRLREDKKDEFDFYYFVQYHLNRQLTEVRNYAHQNGVVIKGDIPIGISRFSVDAWQMPHLFNMNCQAGAPPDDFSVLGQNWGFPTYNWEEMASDGFQWWKNRFSKMSEYFDAYRIDHILGFFRIWQIPLDAIHGLLGYFNPALPFSPEELRNKFDFWIHPEIQCHPLILEWMLTDFFGQDVEEAKHLYLDYVGDGRYKLKGFINTQAKVERHFSSLEPTEKNIRFRDALYGLIDDVLFIEDPYDKNHYHPRISAQYTYQYRCLSDYEKWCFNRLYNDFFYHRHNEFWYGKAMWKLPPILDATRMLACGEDLGMIPDCVPEVMHTLKILSLEIQRMPKDPKLEFGDTWHYPYYSVATTSTHDMPGIRGWWESDREASQRYYNHVLHEGGEAPYFAEPWICEKIVDLQLKSPSMLCILPLQDWLSTDGALRRENPNDELINIPANPTHYWRYRMHLTMEELLKKNDFNQHISDLVRNSER